MKKLALSSLILTFLLFAVVKPVRAMTEILPAAQDSSVAYENSQNYGSSNAIFLSASLKNQGLIKFDLSTLPSGINITGASLKIYGSYLDQPGCSVGLNRITGSWSESSVTWYSRPSSVSTGISTVFAVEGWQQWNVTDLVKSWLANSYPNQGVYVSIPSSGNCTYTLVSRDCSLSTCSDKRPQLVVDYIRQLVLVSPSPTPTLTQLNLPAETSYMVAEYDFPTITADGVIANWKTINSDGNSWPASSWLYLSRQADESTQPGDFEYRFGQNDSVVNHSVTATGLLPSTTYYYRIYSADSSGNHALSVLGTLATKAAVGGLEQTTATPTDDGSLEELPGQEAAPGQYLQQPLADEAKNFYSTEEVAAQSSQAAGLVLPLGLGSDGQDSPIRLSAKNPVVLVLAAVLVILTIIAIVVLSKKGQSKEKKVEKIAKGKTASSGSKRWLLVAGGIVVLILFLKTAPFLGFFLLPRFGSSDLDRQAEELLKKNAAWINRTSFEVPYPQVPLAVKNAKFDCQNFAYLPDKKVNYLCQNLYQTDEESLKAAVETTQSERVFLYGQYSYFDCFTNPGLGKDPVGDCYKIAKFTDNWQVEQLAQMLGVPKPIKKLYYYFATSTAEMRRLCQTDDDNVGACVSYNQPVFAIYLPVARPGSNFYTLAGEAYFFERFTTKDPEPITYKAKFSLPDNCYLFDSHEIVHALTENILSQAPHWLQDGLIRLMANQIDRQLCPPGMSLSDVRIKKDGSQTTLTGEFNPDDLALEEPMTSILVQLSEDDQCRKGVLMQIARSMKTGGTVYLQKLHDTFAQNRIVTDSDAVRAIWLSTDKNQAVKDFLLSNNCVL